MTIAPGTHLGPYEIASQIGAGGMGVVYRAKDNRLGREVAIKVLPPAFAEDAERLRRFEQEARTTSSLSHSNILSVFDTGIHEGSPYLVMELLDGENLREKMDGHALPVRKAIEIARGVAEALAAAHGKGIIHRDIKPENIFLTKDGRVKVLDFGLAKYRELALGNNQSNLPTRAFESGETGAGTLLGTVGYMAPEQVKGGGVDARTDLFALGITLYEMVSGTKPFKGDSNIETLHAILKVEPPDFLPEMKVPPVMERVIRRCLEKEPEARFQSARDLAFALGNLGSGSHPSGEGISTYVPVLVKHRRYLPLLAATFALLLLGSIGTLISSRGSHKLNFKMEPVLPFPMAVTTARFMPDGKHVVFSANTVNGDNELYLQTPGEPAPRFLGVKNARVLAVSPRGEIALDWIIENKQVFAILSSPGQSPKVVDEQAVWAACWDANGQDLILKYRRYENEPTQAFVYKGKLLYRVPYGYGVDEFALTPDGEGICFVVGRPQGFFFTVVGLDGQIRFMSGPNKDQNNNLGQITRSAGKIVGIDFEKNILREVDDQGRQINDLMTIPAESRLLDGLPDGSILLSPLERSFGHSTYWVKQPDQMNARPLIAPTAYSSPILSRGGNGFGINRSSTTSMRSEALVLGKGSDSYFSLGNGLIQALSDKGDRALILRPSTKEGFDLVVAPTGPGREVKTSKIWVRAEGDFFVNGEKAIINGIEVGQTNSKSRTYILDVRSGELKPLPFEAEGPISEDGNWAISPPKENERGIFSRINLETGQRISLPTSCKDRVPVGWAPSGREIWTLRYTEGTMFHAGYPAELALIDLVGGRILSTQTLKGSGTKEAEMFGFSITRDGRSYSYTDYRPSIQATNIYRLSPVK